MLKTSTRKSFEKCHLKRYNYSLGCAEKNDDMIFRKRFHSKLNKKSLKITSMDYPLFKGYSNVKKIQYFCNFDSIELKNSIPSSKYKKFLLYLIHWIKRIKVIKTFKVRFDFLFEHVNYKNLQNMLKPFKQIRIHELKLSISEHILQHIFPKSFLSEAIPIQNINNLSIFISFEEFKISDTLIHFKNSLKNQKNLKQPRLNGMVISQLELNSHANLIKTFQNRSVRAMVGKVWSNFKRNLENFDSSIHVKPKSDEATEDDFKSSLTSQYKIYRLIENWSLFLNKLDIKFTFYIFKKRMTLFRISKSL